jgi:hypothetical protein
MSCGSGGCGYDLYLRSETTALTLSEFQQEIGLTAKQAALTACASL